ncbi:ABC transporter permease, partial [Planctomycetota bacterium]
TVKIKKDAVRGEVKQQLSANSPGCRVKTWEEIDPVNLGNAVFQLKMMSFIMFFLLLITGFMILAILTMIVYQKFKEIGILKSMGATVPGIAGLFIANGFFIGLFGLLLGLLGSWIILANVNPICNWIEHQTGYEVLPSDVYYLSEIPVHINPFMLLLLGGVTLVVSVIAALLPALRAAAMDPAEALRYE